METERRLRYALERIDYLNDLIVKGEEAKEERDELRNEISELMKTYIETVEEMK